MNKYNIENIDSFIFELESLKNISEGSNLDTTEIDSAINLARTIKNMGKTNSVSGLEQNNFKLDVKFKNTSNNDNPKFGKVGDSGFDLRANIPLEGEITLKPLQRLLVPTGLFFELPIGYELQVRSRSGLAITNGVMVLNSPGTVDNFYVGEVKVILINLGQEDFTFKHGDRIAQAVITNRIGSEFTNLVEVMEITDTERGSDGFGSTGIS